MNKRVGGGEFETMPLEGRPLIRIELLGCA